MQDRRAPRKEGLGALSYEAKTNKRSRRKAASLNDCLAEVCQPEAPLCATSSLAGARWKPPLRYRMSTTKSKCAAKRAERPGAAGKRKLAEAFLRHDLLDAL